MISFISDTMHVKSYKVGVYTDEEYDKTFASSSSHLDIEKQYEILEKIVDNNGLIPLKKLDDEKMRKKSLSTYSNGNMILRPMWDDMGARLIAMLAKEKNWYKQYGNRFNTMIYDTSVTQFWGEKNFNPFKDLFVRSGWGMSKISCLKKTADDKRYIYYDDACGKMGTYLAMKEFLLEKEDQSIAFPITLSNGDNLFIKKFQDNPEGETTEWNTLVHTREYDLFVQKIVKDKNLEYIFGKSASIIDWGMEKQIKWLKKAYYFDRFFDDVWNLPNNKQLANHILIPSDIDMKYKLDKDSTPASSTTNTTDKDANASVDTDNKDNKDNKDTAKKIIDTIETSKEIEEWYKITSELMREVVKWFNTYMSDIIFNKYNKIATTTNNSCIIRNNYGSFLIYQKDDCAKVIATHKKIVNQNIYSIDTLVDTDEEMKIGKVKNINFAIPQVWIGFDKMWFRITGFEQKGADADSNQYDVVLRNYYFEAKDGANLNGLGQSQVLGFGTMGIVFIGYLAEYSVLFILLTIAIGLLYNHYLESLGFNTKNEKEAKVVVDNE